MAKKRYRQPKKIKMHSITQRLLVAGLILFCVLAVGFSLHMVLTSLGKSGLSRHAQSVAKEEYADGLNDEEIEVVLDSSTTDTSVETVKELQEGQIIVDGEIYQYNEDILTFLCMGVDSRNGITREKTPGKGGQADAILLLVANPHTETIQVIAVNRDSMVDIELYDTDGGYAGTETKQLALQYAYGDGRVKSCQLMEQTISRLFYGIPIHGYGALDMESIATLNDAVGGVTVTILEDMLWADPSWTKGTQIKLIGAEALKYIRERNYTSTELGTNINRIERQKQYLTLYIQQLKQKIKEDFTFPLSLYSSVEKHMITSLSVDEITYLASNLMGYEFSIENIINLSGMSSIGEKNEEFYLDEKALKEVVIDVFYEKCE